MANWNELAPDIQNALYKVYHSVVGYAPGNVYGNKEDVEKVYSSLYDNPSGRYFDTGGNTRIQAIPLPARYGGNFVPQMPNQVIINPNFDLPHKDTFVHELQHKLDYERIKDKPWQNAYTRDLSENKAWTDTSKDYAKLSNNVKSAFEKYREKYNLSVDFNSVGLIPELKRIESTLPVGQNIFDTDIGKHISKELPNFKFAYFNQTAPSEGTMMYSQDTADKYYENK